MPFLEAVSRFLVAMAQHDDYKTRRADQAQNVVAKIRSCSQLTIEEGASILEQLQKMDWDAQQLSALQAEVAARISGGATAPNTRRQLQNFIHAEHYLTEKLWVKLLSQNGCNQGALSDLVGHLIRLGLKLPSEKTYSKITALLVWPQRDDLSPGAKHQAYKQVKEFVKKHLSSSLNGHPHLPYVQELPENPLNHDAGWMSVAFATEERAMCPLDLAALAFLHSSIRERMSPCPPVCKADTGIGSALAQLGRLMKMGEDHDLNLQILRPRPSQPSRPSPAPSGLLALTNGPSTVEEPERSMPLTRTMSLESFKSDETQPPQPSQGGKFTEEPKSVQECQGSSNEAHLPDQKEGEKENDMNQKPSVDQIAQDLRQKLDKGGGGGKDAKMRKPAACPKQSAKKKETPGSIPMKSAMKKVASPKMAASQKAAKSMKAMKKPVKKYYGVKPKNALQLRPNGCGKCRYKPGCCPSCWL